LARYRDALITPNSTRHRQGMARMRADAMISPIGADQRAVCEASGAGWAAVLSAAGLSAGADDPASAGAVSAGAGWPGAAPVSRSIIERTAGGPFLRTDSRIGAAAPERWMRLCGSGNMIGSSHGPCTMKGSSKEGAAAATDIRLAVP